MKISGYFKRWISLVLCLILAAALFSACGKEKDPVLKDCGILHETEFGGVYITKTIEEFNALGFAYGDSIDIHFSNGHSLEDIPYYNGFYTKTGEALLVAYPGYPYIRAGFNNGGDLYYVAGLTEDATATVVLRQKGRYLEIQEARDISYPDDWSAYGDDVVFANFRNVAVGNIAPGVLYRSASPSDNQHLRAPYADKLAADVGVRYIINLAETEGKLRDDIEKADFNSPHFLSLYKDGKVDPIAMNTNFSSEENHMKLARALMDIADNEGPYLVHCTEGKDRTGFVIMVLEALCGATYQEIVDDYMITYDNYYGITLASDPMKYNVIVSEVLDPMIYLLAEDEDIDLESADLSAYAVSFLRTHGMKTDEIELVRAHLSK